LVFLAGRFGSADFCRKFHSLPRFPRPPAFAALREIGQWRFSRYCSGFGTDFELMILLAAPETFSG
jgi:hypothetical protein